MKFAHHFNDALRLEGFPPHWVERAIPYGELKKCIKRVEAELKSLGLDSETLALMGQSPGSSNVASGRARRGSGEPFAFQYGFTDDPDAFRPRLTLFIQLDNGMAVDATLSPDTRKYLERLAAWQASPASVIVSDQNSAPNLIKGLPHNIDPLPRSTICGEMEGAVVRQVEVPLQFDAEFFGLLQTDVSALDALQIGEQKAITEDVNRLGREVAKVASPSKMSKTDLNRWREIFDLYLQAGVFFSTNELDGGSRSSDTALRQLQWFQAEVSTRGLAKNFKLRASRDALERFNRINMILLQNLKFQEYNQMAIFKILKKFDKRTSLGAKNSFPSLIQTDAIMSQTLAKGVCAGIANEIIKIVPQLDDHLCPVCFSIYWRPVRLACDHVFCIRCIIQMQRAKTKHCPLCRKDVIMAANTDNLDGSMANFLQKYFPKETQLKQKENEFAAGVDKYGPAYANATNCTIM